jgi:hypothetical protein
MATEEVAKMDTPFCWQIFKTPALSEFTYWQSLGPVCHPICQTKGCKAM